MNNALTTRDVLVQAANTAELNDEPDADKVWDFAYATHACDDEAVRAYSLAELEQVFDDAEMGARSYGMALPKYILEVMYPSEE